MSASIVSYVVKDLLTGELKYRGRKADCVKYLDKNPHLWLVCDIVLDTASAVSMNADADWE